MCKKRKHIKADWEGSHDRIILYADIMGFKSTLKKNDHNDIVKKLRDFIRDLSLHLSPYQTGEHLRMTLFSDLVVIAADRCTIPNFKLIVSAAAALMRECYIYDFPINGCITCGPLTFDSPDVFSKLSSSICQADKGHEFNMVDSPIDTSDIQPPKQRAKAYMPLFVGQAVVDAYLLNEDLFCYGIVLHPKAESIYSELEIGQRSGENGLMQFFKLPIPLKSGGFAGLYYLNWTKVKLAKNTISLEDVIEKTTKIESDNAPRARVYARNTNLLLRELRRSI